MIKFIVARKTNLVFYHVLRIVMRMTKLLHKYPSMHFFVDWLRLSLLEVYIC
jgi:hypothetical protein